MQPVGVEGEAHAVMHLGARGRLDRGDHRARPDRDVEQDLRAEPLDHLDHRIEAELDRIGGVGDAQILGADAQGQVLALIAPEPLPEPVRQPDAQPVIGGPQRAVSCAQRDVGEIHRRRADEAGDEAVGRLVIELERLADLLHPAVLHHHHPVAQGHRLDLVVGDVDRGGAEPLVQLLELDAHLDAQLGVQVRQRLVEQEHLRMAHDRAPERDALALTARQLARLAREIILDAEDLGGLLHARRDLSARELPHLQAERHVVVDAHMRIERVVLEHHGDVAVHRRQLVDHPVADQDVARADRLEPGDHAERRRLAAARRADQHDEFLVADLEIDVLHGVHHVAVALVQIPDDDLCHDAALPNPPIFDR
jgi:hypothetical protein